MPTLYHACMDKLRVEVLQKRDALKTIQQRQAALLGLLLQESMPSPRWDRIETSSSHCLQVLQRSIDSLFRIDDMHLDSGSAETISLMDQLKGGPS
jgi:hypothetical protein